MSQTDHYRGKLTPTGKTTEQFIGNVLLEEGCSYEDPEEYFEDHYYEAAVIIDGMVFTVEKDFIDETDDIFKATLSPDLSGSILFEVKYYNGGYGFSEAIEQAIKNKDAKKD